MLPVFLLFAIPIGGGIPAGVLLARSHGLAWPLTAFLYFVSDVALACVFEPAMHGVVKVGRNVPALARFTAAMKESTRKRAEHYGIGAGPLTLIMIAFGVDPMTGRSAAYVAGHGFISGWAIAITGDMMYYGVIAYSTLKLNGILGNANYTTVIIMLAMFVVPMMIKKIKNAFVKA